MAGCSIAIAPPINGRHRRGAVIRLSGRCAVGRVVGDTPRRRRWHSTERGPAG